jgi:membrane protease YdiL (CAAX protease family)
LNTALYGIAWALLTIQGWGAFATGDPGAWLQRPGDSAARMGNRDIVLARAADATPGRRGQLRVLQSGNYEGTLAYAISLHEELLDGLSAHDATQAEVPAASERVRAALSIMLAEAGDPARALEVAGQISDGGTFAAGLSTAYALGSHPGALPQEAENGATSVDFLARAGLEEWMLARPSIHLLEQSSAGQPIAEALVGDLEQQGEGLQRRFESLRGLQLGFVVLGLGLLLAAALRSRGSRSRTVPAPFLAAPWPLADGLGVLVRGEFWGRFYYYTLALASSKLLPPSLSGPFYDWGTLLSSLPLLWLVHRHLLARDSPGPGDPDPLGLRPQGSTLATLMGVTIAALAIDLLVSEALGWLGWGLGFAGHWAEGFDETLAFGGTGQLLLATSNYVIWAPIFEELAFRGLLYFSLRHRLAPLPAAFLSAAIFGLVHFYSVPGFMTTFWSGLVWALAFERTRSLWPCMAAHALYNLSFVAWMILIYR